MPRPLLAASICLLVLGTFAHPAQAQLTLERTPQHTAAWLAEPGVLEVHLRPMVGRLEDGSTLFSPAGSLGFGVWRRLMVGADAGFETLTFRQERPDWQVYGRYLFMEMAEDGIDIAITGAYNLEVGSIDAEVGVGGWIGPVRLVGSTRGFSNGYDRGDGRLAAGGGAVFHPFAGRIPVAIAADFMSLANRRFDEHVAWSVGAQFGLFRTAHTGSVFITNSTSPTLQGRSRGATGTRVGAEFTFRLPAGRALGLYRPQVGAGAYRETDAAPGEYVDIRNFLFNPRVIEVAVGTTIEFTNSDEAVHTVNADDGSFRSGAIRQGRAWRTTFTRAGRYPFHCGPHPYMRGVIVVQ